MSLYKPECEHVDLVSMSNRQAQFHVGQIIHHRLFDYRGVVVDVDPEFQGNDQWYEDVAKTRPPKDKPWYRVLVDEDSQVTYVAEQNLQADTTRRPVHHPLLDDFFTGYNEGVYVARQTIN